MTRWLSKFLLQTTLPLGAFAQTSLMLAGCVLETGEMFAIEATGNESNGSLIAVSTRGTTCSGAWFVVKDALTSVAVECSDDRKGRVWFQPFDPDKPMINSQMRFSDSTTLAFWNVGPEPTCR